MIFAQQCVKEDTANIRRLCYAVAVVCGATVSQLVVTDGTFLPRCSNIIPIYNIGWWWYIPHIIILYLYIPYIYLPPVLLVQFGKIFFLVLIVYFRYFFHANISLSSEFRFEYNNTPKTSFSWNFSNFSWTDRHFDFHKICM